MNRMAPVVLWRIRNRNGRSARKVGVLITPVGTITTPVAAAASQAGSAIHGIAVDTGGFRFANLTSYRDPNFLPGAVKYGDLPGLLSLCAPRPLWLAGEGGNFLQLGSRAYIAAEGKSRGAFHGPPEQNADAAVSWLITGIRMGILESAPPP